MKLVDIEAIVGHDQATGLRLAQGRKLHWRHIGRQVADLGRGHSRHLQGRECRHLGGQQCRDLGGFEGGYVLR